MMVKVCKDGTGRVDDSGVGEGYVNIFSFVVFLAVQVESDVDVDRTRVERASTPLSGRQRRPVLTELQGGLFFFCSNS
jgi:hypothetical protein